MTHESAQNPVEKASVHFSDLPISSELKKGIKELGYTTPTDFQQAVFDNFHSGRNVAGEGQSSYGKSLAFLLPVLAKITPDSLDLQAIILCESSLLADLSLKECRALSRHMGMSVANSKNADNSFPQLLIISADELAKYDGDELPNTFTTVFFDGLSTKSISPLMPLLNDSKKRGVQFLVFGEACINALRELNADLIGDAAVISNTDQPKTVTPAKHVFFQAKDAEPKPRALLGAIEVVKPTSVLITCNEAAECDLLARYLSRYGYRAVTVSEEANRQGLADALRDLRHGAIDAVVCQNSLLPDQALENVAFMVNYDMFDRAQSYEHVTQFSKQAQGLARCIINILTSRELGLLGPIKAQCQIEISEMPLPSEKEILDLCAKRILDGLLKEAQEVELGQFEELAKMIFDNPSSEPIRSLLLRNYFLRNVKPVVRESEGRESRDRRNSRPNDRRRNDRNDRGVRGARPERMERREQGERDDTPRENIDEQGHKSSTEGITRLYVTLGRKDGLNDLASLANFLSDKSGVDLGHFSGSGMIRDTSAHIEVDDDVAEDIIKSVHETPRPSQTAGEEPALIVCERARQTQGHHRRPQQRRRPHYGRRS